MSSFQEFLAQAAKQALDETQSAEDKTHPIDPRAQAMELRDRYRCAMTPAKLEPGTLCRQKRGMGTFKRQPLVVMFWRWLDEENPQDIEIITAHVSKHYCSRADCIIAFLDPDGDMLLIPQESWRLEPCEADYPVE